MSAIHRQFLRFAIVGGGATAINVGAALILNALAGLPPLAANLGGFMLAWTFSYFGHFVWTFARVSAHGLAVPRFMALSAILFVVSQGIVTLTTYGLGWPFWAAMVPVALVVPVLGFIGSRLWAFLPRQMRA